MAQLVKLLDKVVPQWVLTLSPDIACKPLPDLQYPTQYI